MSELNKKISMKSILLINENIIFQLLIRKLFSMKIFLLSLETIKNKYKETMTKKALLAIALLFMVTLIYSSCKSYETCPAYSKAKTSKTIPA